MYFQFNISLSTLYKTLKIALRSQVSSIGLTKFSSLAISELSRFKILQIYSHIASKFNLPHFLFHFAVDVNHLAAKISLLEKISCLVKKSKNIEVTSHLPKVYFRKNTTHNRLTSGELLSNDRLASSEASHGIVRLALDYSTGRKVSAAGVHHSGRAKVNWGDLCGGGGWVGCGMNF